MTERTGLERSLLATLHYFDLADYPVTLMELVRYRYDVNGEVGSIGDRATPAISLISSVLQKLSIPSQDGYYFLPGREAIVRLRQRRHRLAESRYRRAQRVARWIGFLPSVRLVAVSNSLSLSNADADSDIDLFIVTRPGMLWVTRLIAVGTLALLRLRPEPGSRDGKLCLCFFVTENAMDLSRVAASDDDPHFRNWITSFVPLYDAGGAMNDFLAANSWIAGRLPAAVVARRSRVDRGSPLFFLAPLLRLLEPAARAYQFRRFPRAILERVGNDPNVIINDDMLKFHLNDRRAEYEERFRSRLATI